VAVDELVGSQVILPAKGLPADLTVKIPFTLEGMYPLERTRRNRKIRKYRQAIFPPQY
jgi:hypothetical protein